MSRAESGINEAIRGKFSPGLKCAVDEHGWSRLLLACNGDEIVGQFDVVNIAIAKITIFGVVTYFLFNQQGIISS